MTITEVVAVVEIQGHDQLQALAQKLTILGESGLRDELNRALRVALKPAGPAVKQAAIDTLPKKGGLNRRVADQIEAHVVDQKSGVRLTTDKGSRSIDRGIARHPFMGDRERWFNTNVTPGFWTGTLTKMADELHSAVAGAIERVEREAQP